MFVFSIPPRCKWDLRPSGSYTDYIGSQLMTFRHNLSAPSLKGLPWLIDSVGLTVCPEMTLNKNHSTLHNIPEERMAQSDSSFQTQSKRRFKLCGLWRRVFGLAFRSVSKECSVFKFKFVIVIYGYLYRLCHKNYSVCLNNKYTFIQYDYLLSWKPYLPL